MKVIVDELPMNCKDCKFQCFGECLNGADILNCDYSSMKCHLKRGKVKDCPLQSLADYTKQVRKEVCEEIGEQLGLRFDGKWQVVSDGCMTGDKTIMAVLDQIQGENECQKN